MNYRTINIPYAPSYRIITDTIKALSVLQDETGQQLFQRVAPLHSLPFNILSEEFSPAAYVTFGKETEGDNVAVQTDEMRTYPTLTIYFFLYIPPDAEATNDINAIDIQGEFQKLHWYVMQRVLRDPTDDNPLGIGTVYDKPNGKLLYKAYNRGGERQLTRHEWFIQEIERLGETVQIEAAKGFYLSSMSLDYVVNNAP